MRFFKSNKLAGADANITNQMLKDAAALITKQRAMIDKLKAERCTCNK